MIVITFHFLHNRRKNISELQNPELFCTQDPPLTLNSPNVKTHLESDFQFDLENVNGLRRKKTKNGHSCWSTACNNNDIDSSSQNRDKQVKSCMTQRYIGRPQQRRVYFPVFQRFLSSYRSSCPQKLNEQRFFQIARSYLNIPMYSYLQQK